MIHALKPASEAGIDLSNAPGTCVSLLPENPEKVAKEISEEIKKIYPEYSEDEPHKTSAMNKMMTWYGIEMKTFMDSSTSKIAELLLQGTNMGIIEGRRLINENANAADDVKGILHDFVVMQEDSVETLKKYL